MHRYFHSSSNFHSHIPSELDFLVRVKIITNTTIARMKTTGGRTNRRYLRHWRRSRYFMLKSPSSDSSSSSTLSSADGFLRFFNIPENLVDRCSKLSLSTLRWMPQRQEGIRVSVGFGANYSAKHTLYSLCLAIKLNRYRNRRDVPVSGRNCQSNSSDSNWLAFSCID